MKKLLLLFGLWVWNCCAQSTFEFTVSLNGANVVPPSATFADGSGRLALTGNNVSYDITIDYVPGWPGYVYGPAEPGTTGPALFRLQNRLCEAPLPGGHAGYCLFRGTATVSDREKADLLAGLWYLQFTDSLFPQSAFRGQVVLVPEPPSSILVSLAIGLGILLRGPKSSPRRG